MKDRKDDQHNFRDMLESAYYVILPILCVAAMLRGCGARTEPAPELPQQSVAATTNIVIETSTTEESKYSEEAVQLEETVTDAAKNTVARRNPYDPDKFEYSEETGNISYRDENYESLQGIDVSDHQGEIDWEQVADAGYDFVFIRVGYRGYGEEGTLNEDTKAIEYLQEAKKAGLQVGAYFFSQAISEEEAAEEAQFAAEVIKESGVTLNLPLVYDPELSGVSYGRANHLDREQWCANALAFKEAAEKAMKCKVALYANLYWENTYFDVETLNQFEIWYADYQDVPQTNYHFTWWQYSESGYVPGIKGKMDLNLWIRQIG